jgi:general secretion pathway protein M
MTSLPEGIAGKLCAVLLLTGVIAALWLAAARPLLDLYRTNAQRVVEQGQLVDRLRLLAADLPGLRQAAARQGAPAASKLLIDAPSDAVAAAKLQAALKELVAKAGATITSAEALALEPPGSLRRIAVRLTMTGSLMLLTNVLKMIDEASPALLVEDLAVRIAPAGGAASSAVQPVAAGSSDDQRLAITMEIHGFRSE